VSAGRPRRVVTLPPFARGEAAVDFAISAAARGAELLELRTDLHGPGERVDQLAAILEPLVAERGAPLPDLWLAAAALVDVPLGAPIPDGVPALVSHHAPAPLSTDEAVALWEQADLPAGVQLKHVEPLGPVDDGARLFQTQRALLDRFGPRVTVLAVGKLALPFRCVLSEANALDYLAADPRFVAAPGQRLLEDGTREARSSHRGPGRRALLGHRIVHSRSPRIHAQPFDRLELPPDAPVASLIEALAPHYVGFAVTSPFKKVLARHLGSDLEAINTLYRRDSAWQAANTDVEGARAVLEALDVQKVGVLGGGGAAWALEQAAGGLGLRLLQLRRGGPRLTDRPDAWIWTWPAGVEAPEGLTFGGARVAIIAYGPPARRIHAEIVRLGGAPVHLGPRWFVAQARRQRELWEDGA
jgi:hypothetical protein